MFLGQTEDVHPQSKSAIIAFRPNPKKSQPPLTMKNVLVPHANLHHRLSSFPLHVTALQRPEKLKEYTSCYQKEPPRYISGLMVGADTSWRRGRAKWLGKSTESVICKAGNWTSGFISSDHVFL